MALNFLNDGYFAGSVGIGTESPSAKLVVDSGSFAVQGISIPPTSGFGLEFWNNSATSYMGAYNRTTAVYRDLLFFANETIFQNAGTERMRITSAGGISFGSTGTAYGGVGQILKSNGNASPTWIDGSAIPGVPAGSGTLNKVTMWTPDGDTLGDSPITISGSDSTFAGDVTLANGNALRWTSDDVRIEGTTAGDNIKFYVANQTILTLAQASTLATFAGAIAVQGSGDSYFTGSLGIGTTSPTAAKLVVDSSTAPQILVKNSGGGGAKILFEDNTGGTQNASITFDQSSQNTLTIATGYQSPTDLNRINISPAGNVGLTVRGGTGGSGLGQPLVGIGTTSPTEKLEVVGNIKITAALLSNQENTDVDTGTETVASVAIATYTAAFFDFVIKKTTNVRSGTVYACHDGTSVAFTETSTQDLGDTSDVTLSVDISGGNMRLRATTTSDDWSVKSLIRAI